jgi:hypothetical protein
MALWRYYWPFTFDIEIRIRLDVDAFQEAVATNPVTEYVILIPFTALDHLTR